MTALHLTARGPEDLVALVPVVLGFTPCDSVTMLTFAADEQFHARVDMPRGDEQLAEVVVSLVAPVLRHGVRQVAFVHHCDDAPTTAACARTLGRELARLGVAVLDQLRVSGDRVHPALDPGPCGPGRRVDPRSHPFAAEAVWAGLVAEDSREALAGRLTTDPGRAGRVEQALADLEQWCRSAPPPGAVVLREGRWAERLVAEGAEGRAPTDEEVARLLRGMRVTRVRDAAWSTLDRASAVAHVEFWTDVVRRTPQPWLAPPAALLGWSAWLAGHGALAWCAVDRCVAVEPDYTVTTYLTTLLQEAVPPSAMDGVAPAVEWSEGLVGN